MICWRRRENVLRAFDGADAAADAARERAAIRRTMAQVVALAHGRVEIDDLHLGEALEALHPLEHVVVADGEPLALHELHDRAVLGGRWRESA